MFKIEYLIYKNGVFHLDVSTEDWIVKPKIIPTDVGIRISYGIDITWRLNSKEIKDLTNFLMEHEIFKNVSSETL